LGPPKPPFQPERNGLDISIVNMVLLLLFNPHIVVEHVSIQETNYISVEDALGLALRLRTVVFAGP
jgi:hypothetical protein